MTLVVLSDSDGPRAEHFQPLPPWLRRPAPSVNETRQMKVLLRKSELNTVCEEARCPNIAECFHRGTATFMILGDICTRGCRFCSVHTGRPVMPASDFRSEALRVAESARALGLRHVVVTSVTRDDLPDGGASGFVETITALREVLPQATVEVLIPDFRGNENALQQVVLARPDILNHNLETVARLYRRVRPGASYRGSLELLRRAKQALPEMKTKTGIMLGLGETLEEIQGLLGDVAQSGVDIFTAGQYMRPSREHLPVVRYLAPVEFDEIANFAIAKGIAHAFCGPLVRSSYHAEEFVQECEP